MGHFGDIGRLDGFADRLSRALRRLSMCGLRVSVFAVSVPGAEGRDLYHILKSALSDAYEVGRIDSDNVGILYYGPQPGASDSGTRDMLLRDLVALLPNNPLTSRADPHIRALHVSTAQVVDTPELIAALLGAPSRRVYADLKRHAA
jgi:hypothetical protein